METICKFNQFGYCKFQTHCRKQHMMDMCQNIECDLKTCLLRHSSICKYYFSFGRCKFADTCAYLHRNVDIEIRELETQLCDMKIKIPTYILELDIRFISKKMYLEQVLTHDYCLMMMLGGDMIFAGEMNQKMIYFKTTLLLIKSRMFFVKQYSHNGNILFEKVWSIFLQKNIVVKFSCSIVVLIFFSHLNLTYNF